LAEECERRGRWSFFVTSAPLRVPGGVASPPNAIAIFERLQTVRGRLEHGRTGIMA